MTLAILHSKLNRPVPTPAFIGRESVSRLLRDSTGGELILVSAPAGFGKSTAISEWLQASQACHLWYSMDPWDADPLQFFSYLTEGLRPFAPEAAAELEPLVQTQQASGYPAFIRSVVRALHRIPRPWVLALDDFHTVEGPEIEDFVRILLEHQPPRMTLALLTREDPPIPLARLRAAGRLRELRAEALRFTPVETARFMERLLHRPLDPAQLRILEARTEGWAAGLQLAALAMTGGGTAFVLGDPKTCDPYIADYLVEEVLDRQPPALKDFLLKTSALDYFTGDLCDAVLENPDGSGALTLGLLKHRNLFIVPLDRENQWFRYHHLFRDLLRQRLPAYLTETGGPSLKTLHTRAGRWLRDAGRPTEAVRHYLQGEAYEPAADIIECLWGDMDLQLQAGAWLAMARQLPEPVLKTRPVLAAGFGWALLDTGDLKGAAPWLALSEALISRHLQEPDRWPVRDHRQFRMLPATVASAYAYAAAATGDTVGLWRHAADALAKTPEDQSQKQGMIRMLLATAHWVEGDLPAAEAAIQESLRCVSPRTDPLTWNSFRMVLGELYCHMGRPEEAKALLTRTAGDLEADGRVPILLASLYLGLAKTAHLQGDLAAALQWLEISRTRARHSALSDWAYKSALLRGRLYAEEGLLDAAEQCLQDAAAAYFPNPVPEDFTIAGLEALILDKKRSPHGAPQGPQGPLSRERANTRLPEPLTLRELEVLELIALGLSNQEICDRLFLALSTVKGYNQSIFGKLEARRRTEAIARARSLGIV